jgi:hypothetical protein
MDTGDGNHTIAGLSDVESGEGLQNYTTIYTGNGNDTINAAGKLSGIRNEGTINTANDRDSISSVGNVSNRGLVFLGDGNDSIAASIVSEVGLPNRALENFNTMIQVMVTTQLLARVSFTTRVLLIQVMVTT